MTDLNTNIKKHLSEEILYNLLNSYKENTDNHSKELVEKIKRIYVNLFHEEISKVNLDNAKFNKSALVFNVEDKEKIINLQNQAIDEIAQKLDLRVLFNLSSLKHYLADNEQYLLISKNQENDIYNLIKDIKTQLIEFNGENIQLLKGNEQLNILLQNDIILLNTNKPEIIKEVADFIILMEESHYHQYLPKVPLLYLPVEKDSSSIKILESSKVFKMINIQPNALLNDEFKITEDPMSKVKKLRNPNETTLNKNNFR